MSCHSYLWPKESICNWTFFLCLCNPCTKIRNLRWAFSSLFTGPTTLLPASQTAHVRICDWNWKDGTNRTVGQRTRLMYFSLARWKIRKLYLYKARVSAKKTRHSAPGRRDHVRAHAWLCTWEHVQKLSSVLLLQCYVHFDARFNVRYFEVHCNSIKDMNIFVLIRLRLLCSWKL